MNVLSIDIGGHHVKLLASGAEEPRRFESGPELTPEHAVEQVKAMTDNWDWEAVSIGYPGLAVHGRIAAEPKNLGKGWVGFDFDAAFDCPVKVINDAAMQALGAYTGGRMLFLGLGTGLGSAMIVDGLVEPMELAHLPYRKGRSYEDYVGARGLKRLGKKKWRKHVWAVIEILRKAMEPEYVVVGGGNVKKLGELPEGVRRGENADAFTGGFRLWADE